jgi:hypothetical protein
MGIEFSLSIQPLNPWIAGGVLLVVGIIVILAVVNR